MSAGGLPLLRLEVVCVDVLALLGVANHDADIFAILDDGVAFFQIRKCHFVTDRNVVLCRDICRRIVLSDNTKHA